MYLAIVLLNVRLMGVGAYEGYGHALSDTLDNNNLYSYLPDDKITGLGMLQIFTASRNELGYNVDFEYRHQNGVTVCIEEVTTEESFRKGNNQ